jgi:iron-sulfur cluster repair protein YtfE (RIC family)
MDIKEKLKQGVTENVSDKVIRMRKQTRLSGKILRVVKTVTDEVVECEEREQRSDWFDGESQIHL